MTTHSHCNWTNEGGHVSVVEVFRQFLLLGCTSFGGPVAHLGYFRERFVQREKWLTDAAYADLVALCQFLPGPASSQVGMGLGLMRAGWPGALAAWIGFTFPSAILLVLASAVLSANPDWLAGAWVQGMKVAAVAVVAQAVLGMQRKLAPDRGRASLMAFAAVLVLLVPLAWVQLLALLIGAVAGLTLLPPPDDHSMSHEQLKVPVRKGVSLVLLVALVGMLVALPWLAAEARPVAIQQLAGFLQAGSLVFGGGHVVLPLLEQSLVPPGWISVDQFLAGYGAAQAVPGPMFSFAAFLGFDLRAGLQGIGGALLALLALFLPAFLLVGGALPFWSVLGKRAAMRRALKGINAAVVGVLLAALFQPVWLAGIKTSADFSLAMVAFLLLVGWKQPAWRVVVVCGLVGGFTLSS